MEIQRPSKNKRQLQRKSKYFSRKLNRRLAMLKSIRRKKEMLLSTSASSAVAENQLIIDTNANDENVSMECEVPTTSVGDISVSGGLSVESELVSLDETLNGVDEVYEAITTEKEASDTTTEEFHPEGRRLVALDNFLQQILCSKSHGPCGCNVTDMFILQEKRLGLQSIITLKCKMCNIVMDITTDYEEGTELKVNDAATLGIISSGISYSLANEFLSVLNVPFMAEGTYNTSQNRIADVIHKTLWKQMENNGIKEAELARLHGDVDADGTPTITVIADGAWSKRSYNVNYNASSGVACIIGNRTRKILYFAVRNKYCCICARAENKGNLPPSHLCYKNFQGPSTAMEADIIVEGFQKSIEMHGIKYTRLVGDGDSSVYKRLVETRPYGTTIVEKVECTNHLLRNFSKQIREVVARKRSHSKNLPVAPQLRKIVSARAYRLVAAVKKAVAYNRQQQVAFQEQVTGLLEDMKNAASHVFGEHEKCELRNYFCKREEGETNHVPHMVDCGLFEDVQKCFKRLLDNAFSLILNMSNNLAEQYNSIVCKFVGGKRINFSLRRSYEIRAEAAAVSFNADGDYLRILHKELIKKSPHGATKKFIQKTTNRRISNKEKRLCRKQLFKRKEPTLPDEHYGTKAVLIKPDMSPEAYTTKSNEYLEKLSLIIPEEIAKIEDETRGQAGNPKWVQERVNRITASHFKAICSMKPSTSCVTVVNNVLYGTFRGNANTRYGTKNEQTAIDKLAEKLKVTISRCGLFIDSEHCMLGASPDGLVVEKDAVVEVKCPASAAKLTPRKAITDKVITFAQLKNKKLHLKRSHAYYYQVQGQLHVTKRKFCYFAIWTPLGILHEKIKRDDQFWKNKMEKQLLNFYHKCLLPEIIDSRKSRGREIRNPSRD